MDMTFTFTVEVSAKVADVVFRGQKGRMSEKDRAEFAEVLIGQELLELVASLKGRRFSDGAVEVKVKSVR